MEGQKTFQLKTKDIRRKWFVVDASGMIVGRLATRIAGILQGKTKASYTQHMLSGDCVVVINAAKVKFTGNKMEDKFEFRHSGYLGGGKKVFYKEMIKKNPERILFRAVKNMLPKNRLQARMLKNLKIFAGAEHTHGAQMPAELPAELKN